MEKNLTAVLADRLNLKRVGPGYIELQNPTRFVCVYSVEGGLNPMVDDATTERSIIGGFDGAIQQLKTGEEIQIIIRRRPLDPLFYSKNFRASCREEAPDGFKEYFNPFFESWIQDFIKNSRLCTYEAFLLFSINDETKPISDSIFSKFSKLVSSDSNHEDPLKKLQEIRRRSQAWANTIGVTGVKIKELSEDEIFRLLFSEINLKPYQGSTEYLKKTPTVGAGDSGFETLREAITTEPMYNGHKYFQVGEKYLRTMFVSKFPDFQENPHFLSQFMTETEDFKITLFAKGIDQEFAKSRITAQLKMDIATGDRGVTRNYESDANAEERNSVLQAVARRETGLAKASLFITVYGQDQESLTNNYENFTSRFSGIHRYDGFFQQEELFFSSLPLCTNRMGSNYERLHTTSSIANCWPFFFDNLTIDDGAIIGHTAGRELVRLNPWSKLTDNFNYGVFGSPGTGKSFLIQMIENRIVPTGAQVMLIDKSGAYLTSCRVAGGEYIYFDLNGEKHVNPFDTVEENYFTKGLVSPDHQEGVLGFLTTILTEPGQEALQNIEEALLNEAIKRTYKEKFEKTKKEKAVRVPLLSDLREQLHTMAKEKTERSDMSREACTRFFETLSQYVGDGQYANLTDRDTNIDINSNFIVFDTTLAAKREKLDTLITYIISQYCLQRATKNKKKGLFSWIILDEAWSLLSFQAGRKFGEILSRTSRHIDTCNMWATQLIQDGLKNPEARSLFNNAATKIFLKLGDEDRGICAETFEMNEKEVSIIQGLHQIKNVYSQCYLKSSNRKGLVYIVPDPIVKWIATSWGYDKKLRNKYFEHFYVSQSADEAWKAIFALAHDEANNITPDYAREN